MSRDRGQRKGESRKERGRSSTRPALVHLAKGVQLLPGGTQETCVLVSPNGKVHLNNGATSILRLCDGSRTSDQIVAAVMRASQDETLASDIAEFLNVARARGWIATFRPPV